MGSEMCIRDRLKRRPDILKHLEISDETLAEVQALPEVPALPELVQVAGLKLATAKPDDAKKVFGEALATQQKMLSTSEEKLKKILGERKYARLEQIFYQHLLLKRATISIGKRVGLSAEESEDIRTEVLLAEQELLKEVEILRYQKYLGVFREALGHQRTSKLFGDPFMVQLPREEDSQKTDNRRRQAN